MVRDAYYYLQECLYMFLHVLRQLRKAHDDLGGSGTVVLIPCTMASSYTCSISRYMMKCYIYNIERFRNGYR